MKYLVLMYRSDDELNPDIYWTDDREDAENVGESPEYHSHTIVETAKVETYSNEGEDIGAIQRKLAREMQKSIRKEAPWIIGGDE